MKRAGFTMIELIFVIVILGILAAVALPKMVGVQEQARAAKAGELVAQLNSIVVPVVWGKAQIIGSGQVTDLAANQALLSNLIEIPSNFSTSINDLSNIPATCAATVTTASTTCAVLSDSTNSIYIHFRDGNLTDAPRFWYTQSNANGTGNEYNVSKASF